MPAVSDGTEQMTSRAACAKARRAEILLLTVNLQTSADVTLAGRMTVPLALERPTA